MCNIAISKTKYLFVCWLFLWHCFFGTLYRSISLFQPFRVFHETVARRPAKFSKAPEHWKTLDTCCFCCRRDTTSNRAFFRTFASVLISGSDSSSDTRCAWLLSSSCKACPHRDTAHRQHVYVCDLAVVSLKNKSRPNAILKRGITRSSPGADLRCKTDDNWPIAARYFRFDRNLIVTLCYYFRWEFEAALIFWDVDGRLQLNLRGTFNRSCYESLVELF